MATQLTYEEWKEKFINIPPHLASELEAHHNIDGNAEIERMCRLWYDDYLLTTVDTITDLT